MRKSFLIILLVPFFALSQNKIPKGFSYLALGDSYTIGESVKVIDGPFNGFTGSIDVVNEEKRKLEVMVKIFGRKTPLELSYMQVEKL